MTWETTYTYRPQYKFVSINQHGARFKKIRDKKFNVARLACSTSDSSDLTRLILMSHHLNVPVHYDFNDHTAYIEIVSADAVRGRME
ncbi:hypothetical protein LCGC14_0720080 [marine sediment metagenome]|uniref:Uncharacterized protein n=1 Tax=marine sediment metagenome TaxID=412755 RepID=A0A0F9QXS0_9ZZZZ